MGEVWEQSRRMALAIAVGPFVEVSRERLQGVRQRIERVWNERVVPLAERYESQRQARRQNNNRAEYQTSINARLSSVPVAAVIPGNSAAEYVLTSGIYNFLSIYNALLVGRILLTWFPSAPPAIVGPLSSICDPYLNLFRGIIPPLGQIDVSPILAFTALNFFTSAAAALPCEIPKGGNGGAGGNASYGQVATSISTAWMTRVHLMKRKNKEDES